MNLVKSNHLKVGDCEKFGGRLVTCCVICCCLSIALLYSRPLAAQKWTQPDSQSKEVLDGQAALKYRTGFYTLIQSKDYFEAKAFFSRNRQQLGPVEALFSKAFLAGALHQPELALQCTAELLADPADLPDSLQLALWDLQQNSAASLGQYKVAKDAAKVILSRYGDRMSPVVLKLQHNNFELWTALLKEPAQTVQVNQDAHLRMYRDSIGMSHIQFADEANQDHDFIFDLASNVSTANESTARSLHMRFLPGTLSVGSALGHQVPGRVAICDSLILDAIKLHHVVFLVMPDSALSVPKMHYQISAVLGLPVLAAMREIQLRKGSEFFVPQRVAAKRHGLALMMHQGQLIVHLEGHPYELFPGAEKSLLFQPYYETNKSVVELQGRPLNMEMGGSGGSEITAGYQFDLQLGVNQQTKTLSNIPVITSALSATPNHLYGRLGQDFIQSFDTVTINFDKMFVDFQ